MPNPKMVNLFNLAKIGKFKKLLESLQNPNRKNPLDLNEIDKEGKTLLHHLARNPETEKFPALKDLIMFLINNGAKTDIISDKGTLAIHYAIVYKCISVFKLLLPHSDITYITSNNTGAPIDWSLLHYAVNTFNKEIFSELLSNIDLKLLYKCNAEGYTPIAYARYLAKSGKLPLGDFNTIIEVVKEKVKFPPNIRLRDLIFQNKYDELEKCLAEGGDPDEMGIDKRSNDKNREESLLFIAVGDQNQEKNVRFTELLLKYSVNVNAVNSFNETAFERAFYFNNDTRILELLLKAKASPEIQNKNGCTLLHTACTHKNQPSLMVKFLFEKIITAGNITRFSKANNDGEYPIHRAAQNPLGSGVLEFLIKKYPNQLNIFDSNLNTPLHHAIVVENIFCIETLLRLGADLELKNKVGKTCRELLAEKDLSSLLKSTFEMEEGEIASETVEENSPVLKGKKRNNDDDTEEENDILLSVKKSKKTKEYNRQIEQFDKQIQELTKANQLLQKQLQEKNKQITVLQTDKMELSTELSSTKQLTNDISQQYMELQNQNYALQQQNENLKQTNEDLMRQKYHADNTFYLNYTLKGTIQKLQAHIQKLTDQLNAEIAQLRAENEKLKRKEYYNGLSFLLGTNK